MWAGAAQQEYLRLRAERSGHVNPLVDSRALFDRYIERPWRWFLEAPGLLKDTIAATGESQSDPAVEAARLRYLYRRRLTLVLGAIGLVFLILLVAVPR